MSLIAKQTSGSYDLIEAGNHQGVCVAVIDLGTQYIPMDKKSKPQIWITWELVDFPLTDDNGNPDPQKGYRVIGRGYTASLHEKSTLYQHLVAWRGKDFTPEELEGFDIKNVLGANCLVNVVHTAKTKNNIPVTYANVSSVAKLPKGMEPKKATYQLIYDMDEQITPIPEGIPDWIEKKIMASEEYRAHIGGGSSPMDDRSPQAPPINDDDIPF